MNPMGEAMVMIDLVFSNLCSVAAIKMLREFKDVDKGTNIAEGLMKKIAQNVAVLDYTALVAETNPTTVLDYLLRVISTGIDTIREETK